MLIYEYKCEKCRHAFVARQSIKSAPIEKCSRCEGRLHRWISGGLRFSVKGGNSNPEYPNCAYMSNGVTCCGLDEPRTRKRGGNSDVFAIE